jgi:DHA3 family macrolide efflux protein-like MFS transporter
MGVAPNFMLYILFIFISGLAIPFLSAPTTVLLQEMVEVDIQGRVFSILQLIATTALPLGMVIFGPMADFIPIKTLLIVSGLIMAGCSLTIIRNKALAPVNSK